MKLSLEVINPNEDIAKEIFASEDCQTLIKMWEEYYPKIGFNMPWVGYFIMQEDRVIGSCALIRNPTDDKAEISYWTFKEYEGKGIASRACSELISIARKADPGIMIIAKTAPEKNASTTILERNGFVFSEIVQDHEIGDAWEWKLPNNK